MHRPNLNGAWRNHISAPAQLADQIKLYNAQQSWPWEQLARYSAIASGAGGWVALKSLARHAATLAAAAG